MEVAAKKGTDLTMVKCACCGLTEECTEEYVKQIRDRYSGWWICGLCAEVVKDEMERSEYRIGKEEALIQLMNLCENFKTRRPTMEELICAVKQLLIRSLDSPRAKPGLLQSQTCQTGMKY